MAETTVKLSLNEIDDLMDAAEKNLKNTQSNYTAKALKKLQKAQDKLELEQFLEGIFRGRP